MSEAVVMENAVMTNNNTTEQTQKPLRNCVEDAMETYFRQLEGHPTNDLYRMVLAELEEPLFRAVLKYTGGNQSKDQPGYPAQETETVRPAQLISGITDSKIQHRPR